jgi:L-alanine-DL-glutamate epimerase-like enolase superfamily enzyme
MKIDSLVTAAFRIPTETRESDGTIEWDSTTLVVVEVSAGGEIGFGYTYADSSAAGLIRSVLSRAVLGSDPLCIERTWLEMRALVRNIGLAGISSMAISAVDAALWDLKAILLRAPLFQLLGGARPEIPVYGSGGFTSYSLRELQHHMAAWVEMGVTRVKMKVGRDPAHDVQRVRAARDAIGDDVELLVDANGGYARKEALMMASRFQDLGVTWFEEPVPSEDVEGLRLLRDRTGLEIAAGEYGFEPKSFVSLLDAVDVVQVDASRAQGPTGFLKACAIAGHLPVSSHCAPTLHAHMDCAVGNVRHLEYFFDHMRIENLLFDGVLRPEGGALRPRADTLGFGVRFKWKEAERFLIQASFARLHAGGNEADLNLAGDLPNKHAFTPSREARGQDLRPH